MRKVCLSIFWSVSEPGKVNKQSCFKVDKNYTPMPPQQATATPTTTRTTIFTAVPIITAKYGAGRGKAKLRAATNFRLQTVT